MNPSPFRIDHNRNGSGGCLFGRGEESQGYWKNLQTHIVVFCLPDVLHRYLIGFLLSAQKGLDFFNVLALAVAIISDISIIQCSCILRYTFFIIQLLQVIREPIIIDCKQTEERGPSAPDRLQDRVITSNLHPGLKAREIAPNRNNPNVS